MTSALLVMDVQIDVLPRLYEILTPQLDVHSVEGTPLIGRRRGWGSAEGWLERVLEERRKQRPQPGGTAELRTGRDGTEWELRLPPVD